MIRTLILTITCCLSMQFNHAQNLEEPTVGIEIMDTEIKGRGIPSHIAHQLTGILKTELSNCQRFKTIYGNSVDDAVNAQDKQKQDIYRKQETVQQGMIQVTHYQLKCRVLEHGIDKVYTEDRDTKRKEFSGFRAWMSYSYELIEVSNGTTVLSRVIKVQSATKDSKEQATSDMTAQANGWLKRFLMVAFPVKSELLKINTNKRKNKMTLAVLVGGEENDVFRGCRFQVIKVNVMKSASGKEYRDEEVLGELKVKNLKATTCDAKPANAASAKKIYEQYKKGENLQIISHIPWPDPDKPASIDSFFEGLNPFKKSNG